jgi:hypothetical protein
MEPTEQDSAAHRCHAWACAEKVPPELLMCRRHWRMVPSTIQDEVWQHYRPGQCRDRQPSRAWHIAADAAIAYVALCECRCAPCQGPLSIGELALGHPMSPAAFIAWMRGAYVCGLPCLPSAQRRRLIDRLPPLTKREP